MYNRQCRSIVVVSWSRWIVLCFDRFFYQRLQFVIMTSTSVSTSMSSNFKNFVPCGEVMLRHVHSDYYSIVTEKLYSNKMKNIYDLLRRLIPDSYWNDVFYFGLGLLENLQRFVTKVGVFEYVIFVRNLHDVDEIFDLDMYSSDHEWSFDGTLDEDELDHRFAMKLSQFYNCMGKIDYSGLWQRPRLSSDIDLSIIEENFYDFLGHNDMNNYICMEFIFRETKDVVKLIILETKVPRVNLCDFLTNATKNVFVYDLMKTFICLNDLLNVTEVSRLPVYSAECCSDQLRLYSYEDKGILKLYPVYDDLNTLYENIENRYKNVYSCLYIVNELRGFEFASLVKRLPCRSVVLQQKYFYKWLRFAWRSTARGRCAHRLRRVVNKWRDYLYVPRFATSRVQREWKSRFERNCLL